MTSISSTMSPTPATVSSRAELKKEITSGYDTAFRNASNADVDRQLADLDYEPKVVSRFSDKHTPEGRVRAMAGGCKLRQAEVARGILDEIDTGSTAFDEMGKEEVRALAENVIKYRHYQSLPSYKFGQAFAASGAMLGGLCGAVVGAVCGAVLGSGRALLHGVPAGARTAANVVRASVAEFATGGGAATSLMAVPMTSILAGRERKAGKATETDGFAPLRVGPDLRSIAAPVDLFPPSTGCLSL